METKKTWNLYSMLLLVVSLMTAGCEMEDAPYSGAESSYHDQVTEAWDDTGEANILEQLASSDDTIHKFDPRRGTWKEVQFNGMEAGDEFIFESVFFRLDHDENPELLFRDVDLKSVTAVSAPWDPDEPRQIPDADDIVLVLGESAHHQRLRNLSHNDRFAYGGQIFDTVRSDESMQVRPTGQTINRIANTFAHRADSLVDLTVADVDTGEKATISGTPEHPFYVPTRGEYVELVDLEVGETLRGDDGSAVRVKTKESRRGLFDVHNIEVENTRNYLVAAPGFGGPGALVHNKASHVRSVDEIVDSVDLTRLSRSNRRSVQSLQRQSEAHRQKLSAYRRNPEAHDNRGLLENAPSESVRESIIEGRIRSLESQIENFEGQILDILDAGGLLD